VELGELCGGQSSLRRLACEGGTGFDVPHSQNFVAGHHLILCVKTRSNRSAGLKCKFLHWNGLCLLY